MQQPLQIKELTRYRRYSRENNYVFGGHSHAHWEIDIILKGAFEVTYDDTVMTLEENMLVLYAADVFHRSRVQSMGNTEDLVFHFLTDAAPENELTGIYELSDTDLGLLRVLMEEAERNASIVDSHCLSACDFSVQTKQLLEILLLRVLGKEKASSAKKHPAESLYRLAVSYMKDNVDKTLTIGDIAKHCRTSPTKLKTVFQHFTGKGIIAYFSGMKINAAKVLLKKGLSVHEVSEVLGYSSQAYMSLCFKKETGMTPLQFKKG